MDTVADAAERPGWQRLAAGCLLGWHLCSLDAPTVAVVWARALGHSAAVRLPVAQTLVLGLGTWIVYVLDRLLDAAGASGRLANAAAEQALQDRHWFHRQHRKALVRLGCVAAGVLTLACTRLPSRLVLFYLELGVPVAAYAVWVHRRLLWASRLPVETAGGSVAKEAAVAVLFTAATAAPAFAGAQPALRPALLGEAFLLALLCWLNCVVISHAEAGYALAVRSRQSRKLAVCAIGLAVSALAVYVARASSATGAVLLASLLLLSLILAGRDSPHGKLHIRIAADLALLTPLLFVFSRS